jgi:hypothetical protein
MEKVKTHQKLPTVWSEREKLREKGQFWTPSWIAQAMVAYSAQEADLIFDPATGRGAFLDALLKLDKPQIKYLGTDIDSTVLADNIYQNTICEVERRDFIKNPPPRKFKAIVANPPYIRHHRLDAETKTFLKQLCAKITGFTIDGRAGYHIYFLLQALNLLELNGRLAVIMPADTCEGMSAKKIWSWITKNYCLEAVITFTANSTPFPNVDTNAIVFLIKNSQPSDSLFWVKANQAYSLDLLNFTSSDFKQQKFETIEISHRQLKEAIDTGLSRPQSNNNIHNFYLSDFAVVVRGIATGANDFFFLTGQQVKEFDIPNDFLKRAVGRTKDITGDAFTFADLKKLEDGNRPTYLLAINGKSEFPEPLALYLKIGEDLGLPNRPLIKQRKPWYKMEKREIPPLLFAYLGRRNTRFIKNDAGVLPLTSFLCIYPFRTDEIHIENLWQAFNHPDTLKNLSFVGKSYGSGAIKVEPRNLDRLIIPQSIVEQFNLQEGARFRYQTNLFD